MLIMRSSSRTNGPRASRAAETVSRGKATLLAALLGVCLPAMSSPAISQNADVAARQAAGLERVSEAAGEWKMARFHWDRQKNDWAAAPAEPDAGKISFRRMDHGKAFRVAMESTQYSIEGYFTFDVWTERFVLVSIDNQIGQIDVQQGVFVGERLVLDNLRADTVYKRGSLPIYTRLELHFEGGQLRTIRIDSSQDQGQSWKPTSLVRVERIVAAR